jgi:hypothetical protein
VRLSGIMLLQDACHHRDGKLLINAMSHYTKFPLVALLLLSFPSPSNCQTPAAKACEIAKQHGATICVKVTVRHVTVNPHAVRIVEVANEKSRFRLGCNRERRTCITPSPGITYLLIGPVSASEGMYKNVDNYGLLALIRDGNIDTNTPADGAFWLIGLTNHQ